MQRREDLIVAHGNFFLPGERAVTARGDATLVVGYGLRARKVHRHEQQFTDPAAPDSLDDAVDLIAAVCGPLKTKLVPIPQQQPSQNQSVRSFDVSSITTRRYTPRRGDVVVGPIVRVGPLNYGVHVGAAYVATLDITAFDGASKINRPKLQLGDLVYAHVVSADRDADAELSCAAFGDLPVKDWSSGEAVFGPLRGGVSVCVPIQMAEDLIDNVCPVLLIAGQRVAFETAIGMNGRVWISTTGTASKRSLIALSRCVYDMASPGASYADAEKIVDTYFPSTTKLPEVGPMQALPPPA